MQIPPEQPLPLGHAFPHVPQFDESLDRSTQALPH
jgi:hypothetical protein